MDAVLRARMKQWLDNWKAIDAVLEQERWDGILAMSDPQARDAALTVFELWQPDWPTDDGEELLLHQATFKRA